MSDEQPKGPATLADELAAQYDAAAQEPAPEKVSVEEAPEDAPVEVASAEEDQEIEATDSKEDAPEELPPIKAPEHWSAEDKEVFSGLDRNGQEFLLRRHKDMESAYNEKYEQIASVRKAFDPYRKHLQGIDEGQAVSYLLNTYFALRSNPKEGVKWLAGQLGVDLESQQTANSDDEYLDPAVKQLRQELQETKTRLQQFEQYGQKQIQDKALEAIQEFQSQKDEAGNLKYPHFNDVQEAMVPFVQGGASLEDAYERAIWTVPQFRDSEIARRQEEATAKAKKEAEEARKAKAAKAKKAGRAVEGTGNVKPVAKAKSIAEELAERMDAAGYQ